MKKTTELEKFQQDLLGVSARTLQDWEQGRREPTGAARTLLRVAEKHPGILKRLAASSREPPEPPEPPIGRHQVSVSD